MLHSEKIIQITQTALGLTGLSNKGILYLWNHNIKNWEKMQNEEINP